MKKLTADNIFTLLRHSIYGESLPDGFKADMAAVKRHLAFCGMESYFCSAPDGESEWESEILAPLRADEDKIFTYDLIRMRNISALCEIQKVLKENGIPSAVLKGAVFDDCYPENIIRNSQDIDLFVPNKYMNECNEIFLSLGADLISSDDESQLGVAEYHFADNLSFEVHYLFASWLPRKQREYAYKHGMFSEESFTEVQAGGMTITTVDLTFQLIYLLVHFMKHLLFVSGDIKMLSDIAVYVNHYADRIDWERFDRYISENKAEKIADTILGVCMKYLGMREGLYTPHGEIYEDRLIDELTEYDSYDVSKTRMHQYTIFGISYENKLTPDADEVYFRIGVKIPLRGWVRRNMYKAIRQTFRHRRFWLN